MTTFDFNQVREFAANVNAKLDECENGEGLQCGLIDATLSCCAQQCCKFADGLRQWARDVFSGRVAYDTAAEHLWRAELDKLYDRAVNLLGVSVQAEASCYVLEGQRDLQSSLWNLSQLRTAWVSPKLSVGPSARQAFPADPASLNAFREKIASLPPLPPDWKPHDPRQAVLIPKSQSS